MGMRFAAIPMGHEFTSLVLALLWAGGHPPKVEADVIEQIQASKATSSSRPTCPDLPQLPGRGAGPQPDGHAQPAHPPRGDRRRPVPAGDRGAPDHGRAGGLPQRRDVQPGRMELPEILAKIDTGAAARDAAKLSTKAPFDVLVVAGPAGAAAAIYAARKGIRTGIVAERFGGQTLDTLGIENFISVPETEGPKFAAALEAHVRVYDVDIMANQKVDQLVPAAQPGAMPPSS
jgi:alkyl hydroperoxide reductase subunit F